MCDIFDYNGQNVTLKSFVWVIMNKVIRQVKFVIIAFIELVSDVNNLRVKWTNKKLKIQFLLKMC